jgi:hypothetical protein
MEGFLFCLKTASIITALVCAMQFMVNGTMPIDGDVSRGRSTTVNKQ